MKNLIVFLLAIALFSCQKSDSPNVPPAAKDTVLNSVTNYNPKTHVKVVQVLGYDQSLNLATIHGYSYDSSSGTPVIDSAIVSLSSWNGTQPPATYKVTFYSSDYPGVSASETHLLTYDGQYRLLKDSVPGNLLSDASSQILVYDANGHTSLTWWAGDENAPTGYAPIQYDTLTASAGNLVHNINYTLTRGFNSQGQYVVTGESVTEDRNYIYATAENPLYKSELSFSLGASLVFNAFGDYFSKNLPSQLRLMTDENGSVVNITRNYSWVTNGSGRVVSGSGVNASNGELEEVCTYTYR